jgi:hypothetical protein
LKRIVTLGSALLGLLVLVPAASASSLQSGYSGAEGVASAVRSSAKLPFTGLNLTLMIVGGLVLVAIGFTLRRASRPEA